MASVKKKPEDDRSPAETLEAGVDEVASEKAATEAFVAPVLEAKPAPAVAPVQLSTPPAPAPSAAATPTPASAVYRVWPHGTLQRNGKIYQPGETISIREDEASKIPCLVKVDG